MGNHEVKDRWCILKLKPLQMFFHACEKKDVLRVSKNIYQQGYHYRKTGKMKDILFTVMVTQSEPTGVLYGLKKGRET